MKSNQAVDTKTTAFEKTRIQFFKWNTMLQRTGLKPRRFIADYDSIFFGTAEGWFRLSLKKYSKPEVRWIRRILEYLDDSSFQNWAVSWRKTIVWEENDYCYLIQPWIMNGEYFQMNDPASVQRLAEVMADFYRCSKGYVETKGLEIVRDRWSNIEVGWEESLKKLEKLKIDDIPEKSRGGMLELQKDLSSLIRENLNDWRSSGIHSLLEHQHRTGVLGHGDLTRKNIVWQNQDFYLLNWEHLAFQPRILDLATFINDVAYWEPDWILFIIGEFSRVQPFWREEFTALKVLLRYPYQLMGMIGKTQNDELERKFLKEAVKELARKERCLGKVWQELGTEKRWGGSMLSGNSVIDRLSMALSPVESWGEFNRPDTVIQVKNEAKLPDDVIERLTYFNQDRIVGGRDGSVLDGSLLGVSKGTGIVLEENSEKDPDDGAEADGKLSNAVMPNSPVSKDENHSDASKNPAKITHWGNFPKNL